MKSIFLITMTAAALAGNLKADDTYYRYEKHWADGTRMGIPTFEHHPDYDIQRTIDAQGNITYEHREEHRGADSETQTTVASRQEMREEAKECAATQEKLAQAKTEKEKERQEFYKAQAERNQGRDKAFAEDARTDPAYYVDLLPLPESCDNVATIKIYAHDNGRELSDKEASDIRSYMLAHGLLHVSQLGQ